MLEDVAWRQGGFALINGQQQRHVPWPQRTLSEVLWRKHFWHLGGLFKALTWSFLMFLRVFLASKSAGEEVWLEGQFEEPKENKTIRAKAQEHFITRQPFIVQPVVYWMWSMGKTFFSFTVLWEAFICLWKQADILDLHKQYIKWSLPLVIPLSNTLAARYQYFS